MLCLQTPDKHYYVGIDMPSALQSQTILCYEMNNQPLPINQGYPLRLIIPVKYGIKHLKTNWNDVFQQSKTSGITGQNVATIIMPAFNEIKG